MYLGCAATASLGRRHEKNREIQTQMVRKRGEKFAINLYTSPGTRRSQQ
jgi:hypothetical protein